MCIRDSIREEDPSEIMIFAQIVTRSDGKQLMVLMNSVISPVGATVETLRYQLLTVSLIMVVMGLSLAFILSRKIGRPVSLLNAADKSLAEGNYDVRFDGGDIGKSANFPDVYKRQILLPRFQCAGNTRHVYGR